MAASAMSVDPKPIPSPPQSEIPPHFSAIPATSVSSIDDEEDLYGRLKSLHRQLEFIDIQEEYVKDEQKNLKRELLRAQEEVKRIQSVPLVIGQFMEMVDKNNGIVGSTTGSNYYVRILSTINRELLKPSASVALHRHSNALVDVLPPEADSSISLLGSSEKPNVTYTVSFAKHYNVIRGSFVLVNLIPPYYFQFNLYYCYLDLVFYNKNLGGSMKSAIVFVKSCCFTKFCQIYEHQN
jgi:26S proteasome regulatory subunit T3